jgi:Coenzyme PQQ synthesis protein D (PqqD)
VIVVGSALDRRVTVNPDVVFRDIEGETVLLHLERGIYFGLDTIATRVWTTLLEHGCARPVFAALLAEFDVTPQALEDDIAHLLESLAENDLVRMQS